MFNSEIRKLILDVITSWQVLAVTGVLIVYVFIVNSVARLYRRRPKPLSMPKIKKVKPAKAEAGPDSQAASGQDDLEFEEEVKK